MAEKDTFGAAFVVMLLALAPLSAAAQAERTERLDPEQWAIWWGCVKHSAEQINSCTKLIETPEETSQRRAFAHVTRGNAYQRRGEHDHAVADYEAAIKLDPNSGFAFSSRAGLRYADGEVDRAIADYDRVIELKPDALNFIARGNVHLAKADADRALADFDQAIAQEPTLAFAHFSRGNAYVMKGDADRAIASYGEAIKLQGRFPLALANRAHMRLRKKDFDGERALWPWARGMEEG
jgi:tetratricopeptide (TPR) repeat protein